MQKGNHCGESWNDLCLNDAIIAQSQAWANKQELTDLPEWMGEMCCKGIEPEVKMVTGKWVFQFGHLVALEMWREVIKERRRLDWLMDKLVEFKELKVDVGVDGDEPQSGSLGFSFGGGSGEEDSLC